MGTPRTRWTMAIPAEGIASWLKLVSTVAWLGAFAVFAGCCDDAPHAAGAWPQEWLERDDGGADQAGFAGLGRPCPQELAQANAGYIDTLCQGLIPRSGKVWFERQDDGTSCWCACLALQNYGPLTIDSLRSIRRARERQLVQKRARSLHSYPEPKSAEPVVVPVLTDTAVGPRIGKDIRKRRLVERALITPPSSSPQRPRPVAQVHARTTRPMPGECPWGDWEFPFGDTDARVCDLIEQVWRAYPYFEIESISSGTWPIVHGAPELRDDLVHGRTLSEDDLLLIQVPDAFMEAEDVLGEMLVWMLLHEIGHALGPEDPCTPGVSVSCEGGADYWGAANGLRELYDGEEFIRVSKAAQEQLALYSLSLYGDMDHHGTMGCDCPLNRSCDHPPSWCRVKTIQMARWADSRRAACSRHWCEELEECPDCPPRE